MLADGELRIEDPVLSGTNHRMNDAKCDSRACGPVASARAGTRVQGSCRRWAGGRASEAVRDGFHLPNGIGWSPDDQTMYFVDSLAHTIYSAPFDADEGCSRGTSPSLRRVEGGLPDGLAVDSRRQRVGGGVGRFRGASICARRKAHRRRADARYPADKLCVGPTGTLYITTARTTSAVCARTQTRRRLVVCAVDDDTRCAGFSVWRVTAS